MLSLHTPVNLSAYPFNTCKESRRIWAIALSPKVQVSAVQREVHGLTVLCAYGTWEAGSLQVEDGKAAVLLSCSVCRLQHCLHM